MPQIFRTRIAIAILLVFVVQFIGVLGYRYLSGLDWIEAFYMTIITVTTVGFAEVRPLDTTAKIFTILLIVSSVFIFGYAVSVITEFLLDRNAMQYLRRKKIKKKIMQLEGHVVICGFGRNGQQAADKLRTYNRPFVVIERDQNVIEHHREKVLFVEGDANEDEVLLEAGIQKARFLITAVPDDAENLFIVLTARQLNPELFVISRASQVTSVRKLELAGSDKVVMPDKIGGDHMASLVVMPDVITFMDKLSLEGEDSTNVEGIEISEIANQISCGTIKELDLRNRTGCTIIGYVEPDGNYIINPEASQVLEPKGKVIVLGRPEQIRKLNDMFHIR